MNGRTLTAALAAFAVTFAGAASAAQISGKAMRGKEVDLRQGGGKHLVVQVLTNSGQTAIVDLGDAKAIDEPRLRGAEITAQGPIVRVGDRAVLMARSAKVAGQPLSIRRTSQEQASLQQYGKAAAAARGGEQRTVAGTVERSKQVSIGQRGKNLVVAIRTDRGALVTSDLGPVQLALGEDLRKRPIRVEGQLVRVGDRLVLFADRYRTGDRMVQVPRPNRYYAHTGQAPARLAQAPAEPTKDATLALNVGEELLGATVKGGGGANLGIIEDVVADAAGVIEYVLVSPSEQVAHPKAVPWHALRKTEEGYLLPMSEEQFAQAPTYPPAGDISLADRRWHQETFAYYGLLFVPLRTAFNELDADESGAISPEEALANPRLLTNFGNVDADASGTISRSEFSAFEAEAEPAGGGRSGAAGNGDVLPNGQVPTQQ